MSKAIEDVLNERKRQQESLGWTAAQDDGHSDGSLGAAAGCYALSGSGLPSHLYEDFWPSNCGGFKPKTNRRDLVRATPSLIAEIERLDRFASQSAV